MSDAVDDSNSKLGAEKLTGGSPMAIPLAMNTAVLARVAADALQGRLARVGLDLAKRVPGGCRGCRG